MPRLNGKFVVWHKVDGLPLSLDATGTIRLWHTVETPDDRARAWRSTLESSPLQQPFLQAGRAVYRPIPAEQQGRQIMAFARHDVDGAAVFGLSSVAGWRAGYQDGLYLRIAGIRFVFRAGIRAAPSGGGTTTGALFLQGPQDTFAQVPARFTAEAMRRVDLLITVGKRALRHAAIFPMDRALSRTLCCPPCSLTL